MVLVLMYEFLQGETSPWKPYLDMMPTRFETPMFWSPDELRELQASSALVNLIGKDEAEEKIRKEIIPVVREYERVFFPNGAGWLNRDALMALAHRASSVLQAYSFTVDEDGGDDGNNDGDALAEDGIPPLKRGMVPMADMLNADAESNVRALFFRHLLLHQR